MTTFQGHTPGYPPAGQHSRLHKKNIHSPPPPPPPRSRSGSGPQSPHLPVSLGNGKRTSKPSGSSMAVRKRTWPVCPWDSPTNVGAALAETARVSTTPALVPIHSKSLHARRAVIRRQAALCCRIMASEPVEHPSRQRPPSAWQGAAVPANTPHLPSQRYLGGHGTRGRDPTTPPPRLV